MNLRLLACSLVLAVHSLAQNPETATWPTAVVTDAELFVASNSVSAAGATVLNGAINSTVTSIVVNSAAGFVAPVIITIESEIIHCASKASNTLNGCVRGRQGTAAASHATGVIVRGYITAYHFNKLAAEVKAHQANPTKRGTAVPGTCAVGDLFYDTDATAGRNLFGCTATNVWTLQGDGGGGDASTNTATSVDYELPVFSGTGGKTFKRSTLTGVLRTISGVASVVPGTGSDCIRVDGTASTCGGAGGGDASTNTSSSVANELVMFLDSFGKTLKRSTLTGVLKSSSGVASVVTGTASHYVRVDGTSDAGTAGSVAATALTGGTEDGVPVGNGTNFAVKVLPSCSDATASKLLYNSATNTFSCGSDQSAGAPAISTVTGGTEDALPVGNGTTFTAKVLPSCSDTTNSKLLYNSTTNAFSCGADQNSGGGGGTTYAAGPSGALAINTTPTPDEIDVTAAVPLKATANTWTGANDFSAVGKFSIRVVTSDPGTCDATVREMMYNSTSNLLKVCNTTNTWTTITGGGGGGGDALVANPLSQFAATTGAQLAGVITNESGTGVPLFQTSPTIVTPTIGDLTNANHAHTGTTSGGTLNATAIAAGTMATARMGSGTANSSTVLYGNNTWGSISAGASPDPTDVAVISMGDEFLTGDTSVSATTGLGAENWRWVFNNAAPTISYEAPVANHFGIMQVVTSANSGETTSIQSPINGGVIGMNGVANWTFVSVFKTDSATTNLTELYTGFGTGFGNSITIVYQPATSANWLLRTCSGFTCTDVSTAVAYANSTWFTFTIDSAVAGTVGGKVNAGSRVTSATNVYSGALPIVAIAANTNGSARTFQLDKTAFKITGIVR